MTFATISIHIAIPQSNSQLLLRFKPGVPEGAKTSLVRLLGLRVVDYVQQIDVYVVSAPDEKLRLLEPILRASPLIDLVEVDHPVAASRVPGDPYYSVQWHLQKIGCPSAWDISTGSSNVIIAVIDSGVDPSHPDLAGKLLPGWNFYDNNDDTSDLYGHGTKVAGVVAAVTNNGVGVAGVAWNCTILPVRVTSSRGYTTPSLLSRGLIYAADRGARVAVVSFHVFGNSVVSSAAKYFVDRGGVVVAAAGNTGKYESYGDDPYVISVSATTNSDAIASFSSYGPYVDLSAPGSGIYTTFKGGYGAVSGTSFSAPIVAGVAALMLSVNPSLTPAQVEQILESTAVDIGDPGYDVYYGWGRVDAYAALKAALEASSSSCSMDAMPPSVEIVYPADGEAVSGSITVRVEASDDRGISKVELYKNGELFAVDPDPPYEFHWNTTDDADGAYALTARAYDMAGNAGASNNITVTVSNSPRDADEAFDSAPPTVKIIKPLNEQVVAKSAQIVVSASDDSGIDRMELCVGGSVIAVLCAEPYACAWDAGPVKDGRHMVTAKAYDIHGKCSEDSMSVCVQYVGDRSVRWTCTICLGVYRVR